MPLPFLYSLASGSVVEACVSLLRFSPWKSLTVAAGRRRWFARTDLLYRWFVGLGVDLWVPTVFSKNRDRLLEAEVARKFLSELLTHKEVRALCRTNTFRSTAACVICRAPGPAAFSIRYLRGRRLMPGPNHDIGRVKLTFTG